jgi:hypothetical protein
MAFMSGDKPQVGAKWGHWTYLIVPTLIGNRHVLRYQYKPHFEYDIPLEQCTTSAQTLDWIIQMYKRPLMEEGPAGYAEIGYLLEALNDLLYPQRNLCSGGQSKTMDVLAWLNR